MCPDQLIHANRQKGIGLPGAIFVITVLAFIVIAMTQLEVISAQSYSQNVQSMRAFYAAESGAEIGLHRLFQPSGGSSCTAFTETFGVAGLQTCSASVTCSSVTVGSDNYYTIRSTGSCGTGADLAQRIVEVRAR